MKLLELIVRRRVFAYMLSAVIMLFGVVGLKGMGIDRAPNIEPPVVTITTAYPGASPEAVDAGITSVLESSVNTVPQIDNIDSSSSPNLSHIRILFDLEKDPETAFNEVQAKVNQVVNRLPQNAETPVVARLDPNAVPVTWLVVEGDRPQDELYRLANHQIKKSLEALDDVGQVILGGGYERKLKVRLDVNRMSAFAVSVQDVIGAFRAEHVQVPGGYLVQRDSEALLHTDLEYHSSTELKELIVAHKGAMPVHLGDIAILEDGIDRDRGLARFDGKPAIALGVVKVPKSNTVALVRDIRKALDAEIRPALPRGVSVTMATDESHIIEQTVDVLQNHLIEGVVFAAAVVLLFILAVRATLIIAVAIPISLLGAVAVMHFAGYTFNIMTMSGLLLLIGVVVDDAIVVLENIHRNMARNPQSAENNAVIGTQEVLSPVFAASLTLICIFATVVFIEGIAGVFLSSFAVVVTVGVITSLLVSLTLTPALCARFLRADTKQTKLGNRIRSLHRSLEMAYRALLTWSLSHRIKLLAIALITVLSTGWFLSQLGSEFLPRDDESRFKVKVKTPRGSSIDYTREKIEAVERYLLAQPEVAHTFSTVANESADTVNSANVNAILKPMSERELDQKAIMARAQRELMQLPGADIYVTWFPLIAGLRGESLEVHLTGPDLYRIADYSEKLLERMREHSGFGAIDTDFKLDQPTINMKLDRERARSLGVRSADIGQTVGVLAGGLDIGQFNEIPADGERYDIELKGQKMAINSIADLKHISFRTRSGDLVRMDVFANFDKTYGPSIIQRRDLNYSAAFYSTPDISLGEAASALETISEGLLPPGYKVVFGGQADQLAKTIDSILFVFATALMMVYMVLASQFNSFYQPLLIMLAQPLAIIGGVVSLWLVGHTLNIYSMIGLVLLIGLVTKNSILLVDLINRFKAEGMATHDAILEACPQRLRPVLMTSLTVVLAMLPAAIGTGPGSGQYGPLAVAVLGGVISSTLLTLVVVPVAYSLLEYPTLARSTRGHRGQRSSDQHPIPESDALAYEGSKAE